MFLNVWLHVIESNIKNTQYLSMIMENNHFFFSFNRPGHGGANAVGRGVLSMQGLSYGVVRVDQENSLTSLTLQDCGQVLPGGS